MAFDGHVEAVDLQQRGHGGSLPSRRDFHYGRSGNPGAPDGSRDVGRDQVRCPRNAPTRSFDCPRRSGSVARVSEPWTFSGKVAGFGQTGGVVTLVDESTFTISGREGDIVTPSAEGLFVRDTRILSRFELRVNGARPESLAVVSDDPFSATFVSRCPPRPGLADSTLMVFRAATWARGCARTSSSATSATSPRSARWSCSSTRTSPTSSPSKRVGSAMPTERSPASTARHNSSSRTGAAPSAAVWPSGLFPTPARVVRRPRHLRGHRPRPRRMDGVPRNSIR